MQVDADSLGDYLRREREVRHMSLQDMSAATKIQLRFLEALEQDNYDQLPPTPFVVGFLRSYAQCLSLAPDDIVAAYHAHYGSSEEAESLRLSVTPPARRFNKRFVLVGLGLLAVVAVLGVTVHVLQPEHKASTGLAVGELPKGTGSIPGLMSPMADTPRVPSAGLPTPALQMSVPSAPKAEPEPHSSASATPKVSASKPLPEPLPKDMPPVDATKRLVLRATAVEDTWLSIEIDGDKRSSVLLRSGKDIQWEATERFVLLTIGNARGTRLALNGREIPLPSTRGNVLRDFPVTRELSQ
jgi:cytoskeleton protein RodZ